MPNANYERGRSLEYKIAKRMREKGYNVIRASGSHGLFDLACFRSDHPSIYIQCKHTEDSSLAQRLLENWRASPPLTPSRFFKQVLHVYDSTSREHFEVTL